MDETANECLQYTESYVVVVHERAVYVGRQLFIGLHHPDSGKWTRHGEDFCEQQQPDTLLGRHVPVDRIDELEGLLRELAGHREVTERRRDLRAVRQGPQPPRAARR